MNCVNCALQRVTGLRLAGYWVRHECHTSELCAMYELSTSPSGCVGTDSVIESNTETRLKIHYMAMLLTSMWSILLP